MPPYYQIPTHSGGQLRGVVRITVTTRYSMGWRRQNVYCHGWDKWAPFRHYTYSSFIFPPIVLPWTYF